MYWTSSTQSNHHRSALAGPLDPLLLVLGCVPIIPRQIRPVIPRLLPTASPTKQATPQKRLYRVCRCSCCLAFHPEIRFASKCSVLTFRFALSVTMVSNTTGSLTDRLSLHTWNHAHLDCRINSGMEHTWISCSLFLCLMFFNSAALLSSNKALRSSTISARHQRVNDTREEVCQA